MRVMMLVSASLAALGLSGMIAPTFAAEAAAKATADTELETVIVTAEKRPENVQNTPISVSVLSGNELDKRHVVSLLDLNDGSVPSLRVAPFFTRSSALIVNIRGVGVQTDPNQPARDMGVGVYIDGVYLGRSQGLGTAIYDVESIEVLKGPQGTLFGRNTEGGAVSVTTKKPSGQFKLSATASVGNYGSGKGEVHLDLPSWHDISLKIDGLVTHRDGTMTNSGGNDFNAYDRHGIHAQALWRPNDRLSADYSFDISRDATTSMYVQLLDFGTLAAKYPKASLARPNRADASDYGVPEQFSVGNTDGHRLTIDYKLSPSLTLKSISAVRGLVQTQYDNGGVDTSPSFFAGPPYSITSANVGRYSLANFNQNQYSQEFQAIGSLPRLDYVAGALYFHEYVRDNAVAFYSSIFTAADGSTYAPYNWGANNPPYGTDNHPYQRASRVTTTSMGLFGQGTYTPPILSDKVHLTVGGRYTKDKKAGSLFVVNGALPVLNGVAAPIPLTKTWNRVDPLVNLAYDVTTDVHAYAKWSTGYRSGGANSRSLVYRSFEPETVSTEELGLKSELFDHRVRANFAAYTGTYKHVQLDYSAAYVGFFTTGTTTTTRTTTETTNAVSPGRIGGFEADVAVNPMTGLTFTASYALNVVKLADSANPFPLKGNFDVNRYPVYQDYTPRNSASFSADYERRLSFGKFQAHLDANYSDGFYQGQNDPVFFNGVVIQKQPKGDAALVTNGRVAISNIELPTGGSLTASLWARNLLNEEHVFYKQSVSSLSSTGTLNNAGYAGIFNEPRTFGAELNLKY